MAAPIGAISLRLPSTNFNFKRQKSLKQKNNQSQSLHASESLLSTETIVKDCSSELSCLPVIIEFRRLLQSAKCNAVDVVPGVPNTELLHTVVGLYDTCLPDITPAVLYATVTGKGAKTLILVRKTKDVARDLQHRIRKKEDAVVNSDKKGVEQLRNRVPESSDNRLTALSKTPLQGSDEDNNHDSLPEELCHTVQDKACMVSVEGSPLLMLLDGKADQAQGGDGDSQSCHGDRDEPSAAGDEEDVLEEEEARKIFGDVFSDSDCEEDESDEEEEEVDFSRGINEYLRLVKKRRAHQDDLRSSDLLEKIEPTIGIESRIVSCATWEKSHIRPGEKIIQIDLMAVRKRYRKCGIGRYLLRQMKDASVVGPYDSLVVYADHSAVDFFALHGFSDDIVLNSKYSELADNWTNCTLMCFIPPFVGQTILKDADMLLDLKAMELELQKWTERSREAYQGQVACIMKLRHEVIALRALVSSQKALIQSLSEGLETLQADKLMLEKSNLEHKIAAIKAGYFRRHGTNTASTSGNPDQKQDELQGSAHDDDDSEDSEGDVLGGTVKKDDDSDEEDQDEDEDGDIDTDELIKALEAKAFAYQGIRASLEVVGESSESLELAAKFEAEMRDQPLSGDSCTVTKITVEKLVPSTKELYEMRVRHLGDPSLCTCLYFCGSLLSPERIPKILTHGFSEEDFSCGDYGMGMYFSENPSIAAQFSAIGKMLVAEVGLGKTATILKRDRSRVIAPMGFDSILTPGRMLCGAGAEDNEGHISMPLIRRCKEYVIFDPLQAVPKFLIEYSSSHGQTGASSVRL